MGSTGQFTPGEAVTYVALGVKQFTGEFVDITVTTSDYEVLDPSGHQLDPQLIIAAGTDVVRNLDPPAPATSTSSTTDRRELLHPRPRLLDRRRRHLPQPRHRAPTSAGSTSGTLYR